MTTQGQLKGSRPRCTKCRELMDGYTAFEPETYPRPGDLGICATCGTVHVYTVGGMRKLGEQERAQLPAEAKVNLAKLEEGIAHGKAQTVPESYAREIQQMATAATAWLRAHPELVPEFHPVDPGKLKIAPADRAKLRALIAKHGADQLQLIASLPDCYEWWPANEGTLELLRVMDSACHSRGTYMMAKAALELMRSAHVTQAPVRA